MDDKECSNPFSTCRLLTFNSCWGNHDLVSDQVKETQLSGSKVQGSCHAKWTQVTVKLKGTKRLYQVKRNPVGIKWLSS